MKKRKLLALTLSFALLSFLFVPASALSTEKENTMTREERHAYDSVDLSEEENAAYAQSPEDTLLKIYARADFLTREQNLDQLLEQIYFDLGDETLEWGNMFAPGVFPLTYYASISPSGEAVYTVPPVEATIQPFFENKGNWAEFYTYATTPSTVFLDESITVYNVFCFCEDFNISPTGVPRPHPIASIYYGMYIYYETSCGDFILWDPPFAHTLYVFTVEEFSAYGKAVKAYYEQEERTNYLPRPSVLGVDVCTLDEFDIQQSVSSPVDQPNDPAPSEPSSPDTTPYFVLIPCAIGSLLLIGVCLFAIIRKKKRA